MMLLMGLDVSNEVLILLLLQSTEEKFLAKQLRKEEKRSKKDRQSVEDQELAGALDMSPEELRRTRSVKYRYVNRKFLLKNKCICV